MLTLSVVVIAVNAVLATINDGTCIDTYLSNKSTLSLNSVLQHIDVEFQKDQECKYLVNELLGRIYESEPRHIPKLENNMSYGCALPTNAEVTDYLLSNARGKTIVSLAGAAGEDMILSALAGAKRVINNDINPNEMSTFNAYKDRLPVCIQANAEDAPCSCLDLLTHKPNLKHTCDFVLCNNLIHFFSAAEQATFFELVRDLLAPGGQLIVTANAINNDDFLADRVMGLSLLNNPYHTCFTQVIYYFYSASAGNNEVLYHKLFLNNNDFQVGRAFYEVLYQDQDSYWVIDQTAVSAFIKDLGTDGAAAYAELSNILVYDSTGNVVGGEYYITKTSVMACLPIALRSLLEKNGFEVETTFCVNDLGHTIQSLADKDTYDSQTLQALPKANQPSRVGVIAHLSSRPVSMMFTEECIKHPDNPTSFLDSVYEKLHAISLLFCLP
jgi:SAM-dependent methyltransferase